MHRLVGHLGAIGVRRNIAAAKDRRCVPEPPRRAEVDRLNGPRGLLGQDGAKIGQLLRCAVAKAALAKMRDHQPPVAKVITTNTAQTHHNR